MKQSVKEKLAAANKAVGTLDKMYGLGTVDYAANAEPIRSTPTGSSALDAALGVGGWPRGRIVEVFGPESSGKTTLTPHAIAEAQKPNGTQGTGRPPFRTEAEAQAYADRNNKFPGIDNS